MSSTAPQITNQLVNGIVNPIGFELGKPSFSWVVTNTKAKEQKTARVEISTDPEFLSIVSDSGMKDDINSIDYTPSSEFITSLKPYTRYYWRVTVVTDLGETITSSKPYSFFETGKMDDEWRAKWVSTEVIGKDTYPLIKKEFQLLANKEDKKKIINARAYVTGLGIYELYLNGEKVGDEFFAPYYTNYNYWIQYQTFDITEQLNKENSASNVIGAMLGEGWARGRISFHREAADFSGKTNFRGSPIDHVIDHYSFLCEVRVVYEDGTIEYIGTDETWKCTNSPITHNNFYDGEIYDSNREIDNWSHPKGTTDQSLWKNVVIDEYPKSKLGKLTGRMSLPVIIKERIKPIGLIKSPKGETIIDFGQNFAGFVEITLKNSPPKGFETLIEHCEILEDGNFYRGNLNTALALYKYISNGKENGLKIHPHFTFMGFRYIRLTQWHGEVNLNDFEGCLIYSDLQTTGKIETGNQLVDRFCLNSLWSQKDNFLDIPTDCPQRDERMGWLGDAQVFCPTAMFNMNCYAFYHKFSHDLYLHQADRNGSVPHFTPYLCYPYTWEMITDGCCGWADAATVIPYMTYLFNGKIQILEEQIKSMKDWCEYVRKQTVNGLWVAKGFQFGDWLGLDGPNSKILNPMKFFGGTENTFICSAYHYYSLNLVIKGLKALKKEHEKNKSNDVGSITEEINKYSKWAEETLDSLRQEYITANGRCAIQTQTAHAMAIFFGITPKEKIEGTISELHRLLETHDYHLCTGFLGTPILCRALSQANNIYDAYTIFLQTDCPSWLYQVKMGATTIWERWDGLTPEGKPNPLGMISFNHYSYSSVLEWLYRDVCGINPDEENPGFKHFILAPNPDKRLGKAHATYESPMGLIKSGWEYIEESNSVKYHFVVPFNTKAELHLNKITKQDIKVEEGVFGECSQNENGFTVSLCSGTYAITCPYDESKLEIKDIFK